MCIKGFLEQYGVAIFTLVLTAILIAFAGPIGLIVKKSTNERVKNVDQIGTTEIIKNTSEAVDKVWCGLYSDGELIISQNNFIMNTSRGIAVEPKQIAVPKDITNDQSQIKTVNFKGIVKPKSCQEWFKNCINLIEIKNIENLNTSECTDMSWMFYKCNSLINLDVSNWDVSNVKSMYALFTRCSNITSLDLTKWNTSNVESFDSMFQNCENLTTLDLSHFDTSKAITLEEMFLECYRLKTLDISNFNTANTKKMFCMFEFCCSLTSLDLSHFDVSNVIDIHAMFNGCDHIKTLNLSNWTLQNVKDFRNIFENCSALRTIIASSSVQEKFASVKPSWTQFVSV